jgi:hypothetical protein
MTYAKTCDHLAALFSHIASWQHRFFPDPVYNGHMFLVLSTQTGFYFSALLSQHPYNSCPYTASLQLQPQQSSTSSQFNNCWHTFLLSNEIVALVHFHTGGK